MQDPAAFLRAHPLRVRGKEEQGSPFSGLNEAAQPPVFQFDIQSAAVGVELVLFGQHPKTHSFGTQRPITAYWLDYKPEKAEVVNIQTNHADYLFTPLLDGCYIGVGNGHVTHVAGDISHKPDTAAMRVHAQNALGGALNIGFDSNPTDAPMCTFVGVRRHGLWSWYVQGHGYFYENHGAVEPIFRQGPNAGDIVIQLTDLSYG